MSFFLTTQIISSLVASMDRFVEKGMRKDEMKQATTKAILIDDGKDCLVIHVIQSQLSQYIIKVYQ